MPTKIPMNQHIPLHDIYGSHDCCLCRAEERIKELEKQVKELGDKKKLDKALNILHEYFQIKNLDLKEPERCLIDAYNTVFEFVQSYILIK